MQVATYHAFIRDGVLCLSYAVLERKLSHIRCLMKVAYCEGPVAFTGHCLEHLPVSDAQIPAPVTDRSRRLHLRGDDRNACAAHAEVVGRSLLSHLDLGLLYAIGKQQQPDRKSLLQEVENGAGVALGKLRDVLGGVT